VRRLGRETHGDGSPDTGFSIAPARQKTIFPLTVEDARAYLDSVFGSMRFFLNFPGPLLDDLEQPGFALSSPQGLLRVSGDRPHQGQGFLRLSGHAGTVDVRRTLSGITDLSGSDLATFWYRCNRTTADSVSFFLEDDAGGRTVWPIVRDPAFPANVWAPGVAAPLNVRFRVLTATLQNAVLGTGYDERVIANSGTPPYTWSVTGSLPSGVTFAGEQQEPFGSFSGSPTKTGTFTFTIRVTDAHNQVASEQFTLVVQAAGPPFGSTTPVEAPLLVSTGALTPTGTPANLARIHAYGFEAPQDSAAPLVWDFDDLRLGSIAGHRATAANNFVIRGPLRAMLAADIGLAHQFDSGVFRDNDTLRRLVDTLAAMPDPDTPDPATAARMHVAGLTCLQTADVLYSEQADPNDPLPGPPPSGQIRQDTVYLDVWTEPVTYVDDPDIREIALGGPDTATRSRIRQRVRVAQGAGLPAGDGRGSGTLAPQGSYTAQANRLYLVEIETAGEVGTATFRWSEDNAATIQRVPPGSTQVVVEDATAFAKGDQILIRKEFGAEEHQVASVTGNVIGLAHATGAQLAARPAAGRVAGFTTFALADRPMVQRWNAFGVPVTADPADPTVSAAIALNDGVAVRFGGHDMRTGDYWNFRTRFLGGDAAAGIDPVTRIEQLGFQRPRGTAHHYVPLAKISRNGSGPEADLISIADITDLRPRAGLTRFVKGSTNAAAVNSGSSVLLGSARLPSASPDSRFLTFWSGGVQVNTAGTGELIIFVSFYNDEMTDPIADPLTGRLFQEGQGINLAQLPAGTSIQQQMVFTGPDNPFQPLGGVFVPTSVQVTANLSGTGSVTVGSGFTVMELKKSAYDANLDFTDV
jgi:hypothetical protein